jgi:hypothetical protein
VSATNLAAAAYSRNHKNTLIHFVEKVRNLRTLKQIIYKFTAKILKFAIFQKSHLMHKYCT